MAVTVASNTVASAFGVALDKVRVVTGDTDNTPYGGGTWASRAAGINMEACHQMGHIILRIAKATAEAHLRHAHPKPIELQRALLLSTTSPGEVVVDPAAGSFSVLEAIKGTNRDFLGCDLVTGTTEVGPRK